MKRIRCGIKGWLHGIPVLILLCVLPVPGWGLEARFDWNMPDRFGFVDGDGKVIYYTTATDTDGDGYEDNYPLEPDQILNAPQEIRDSVADIRKDTFRVEFNACSSEGSIERYEWIIDGVARPPVSDCLTSIELREGTYKVQLRVSDLSFSHTTPETEVIVQDFLVVALGDSYASGEGAPEKPLSENYWQDLVSLQQAVRELTQEFNIDNIALTAAEEAAARIQEAAGLYTEFLGLLGGAGVEAVNCGAFRTCMVLHLQCLPSVFPQTFYTVSGECGLGEACSGESCPDPLTCTLEGNCKCDQKPCGDATNRRAELEMQFKSDLQQLGLNIGASLEEIDNKIQEKREALQNKWGELQTATQNLINHENKKKALWQDRRCHRSAGSGQARAALNLERLDPKTSVTFLQLSCSGATIKQGLLNRYWGVEYQKEGEGQIPKDGVDKKSDFCNETDESKCIPSQLEHVRALLGDIAQEREIDALVMSIGGNDAYFAPIIMKCMLEEPCYDNTIRAYTPEDKQLICEAESSIPGFEDFKEKCRFLEPGHENDPLYAYDLAEEGLRVLPEWYSLLNDNIVAQFPHISPADIHLTEYLNPGLSFENNYCGQDPAYGAPSEAEISQVMDWYRHLPGTLFELLLQGSADLYNWMPGFSKPETYWASTSVAPRLNGAVDNTNRFFGWTAVSGIFDQFGTPRESCMIQFDSRTWQCWRTTPPLLEIPGHGVCSRPPPFSDPPPYPFFNTLVSSFLQQGDITGAVHPTGSTECYSKYGTDFTECISSQKDGHSVYRDKIFESLSGKLYADGKPRHPQQAPVAKISKSHFLKEGQSIALSNDSFDYNNDPIAYAWDAAGLYPNVTLAGASSSSEKNPVLVAADDADGFLSFSAKESSRWGYETMKSVHVVVANVPPKIEEISLKATSIPEGSEAVMALYFSDPGPRDTHDVTVDWSDGTTENYAYATSPFNMTHTYRDNGSFEVVGTVRDDDGGSASGSLQIVVVNVPPQVEAGTDQKDYLGTAFSFSGTFTDPGVLDTHTFVWEFGDGSTQTGSLSSSHKYLTNGVFTATLAVTDKDGGIGIDTLSVKVMSAQDGAADINEYIQGLSPDQFVRTPQAYKTASGEILSSVIKLLNKKAYKAATSLLQKELRSRFDGSLGGLTQDDWSSVPAVQAEIISRIDRLIAYISTLT